VDADFSWDLQEQRIGSIVLKVKLPYGLSEKVRDAVSAAVLSCPARKMLMQPPSVEYDFQGSSALPAVATRL
jgi:hypothetical protein